MNELYFPLYVAWSATWAIVMVEYTRAAHREWRDDHGEYRHLALSPIRFIAWYLTSLGNDIIRFVRHRHRPEPALVQPERAGRWLRLFVGLSALNMGVSGLATSLVDRTEWAWWQHSLVFGGVSLSLIAAQGHLALAWSSRPVRWRLFWLGSAVWMPIGWFLRTAMGV